MHSHIYEISENFIPQDGWTTENDIYESEQTYWDYITPLYDHNRETALKELQSLGWFKALFTKGENEGEIVYNGKMEEAKEQWQQMIQDAMDKMKEKNITNTYRLTETIEKGIFGDSLFYLPHWSGPSVVLPETFWNWISRMEKGQVLHVNSIYDYHS